MKVSVTDYFDGPIYPTYRGFTVADVDLLIPEELLMDINFQLVLCRI